MGISLRKRGYRGSVARRQRVWTVLEWERFLEGASKLDAVDEPENMDEDDTPWEVVDLQIVRDDCIGPTPMSKKKRFSRT